MVNSFQTIQRVKFFTAGNLPSLEKQINDFLEKNYLVPDIKLDIKGNKYIATVLIRRLC